MRILVMEDEPNVARFLKRGLKQQTYAVDVAGTGEDGLQPAGDHEVDLIVLDVMLSGPDGFAVRRDRRVRGCLPNLSTPVCALGKNMP